MREYGRSLQLGLGMSPQPDIGASWLVNQDCQVDAMLSRGLNSRTPACPARFRDSTTLAANGRSFNAISHPPIARLSASAFS